MTFVGINYRVVTFSLNGDVAQTEAQHKDTETMSDLVALADCCNYRLIVTLMWQQVTHQSKLRSKSSGSFYRETGSLTDSYRL